MTAFWSKNSKEASLEEMMLNSDAKSIRSLEEPEVLGSLPSLLNKDVVELACGIGYRCSRALQVLSICLSVFLLSSFWAAAPIGDEVL